MNLLIIEQISIFGCHYYNSLKGLRMISKEICQPLQPKANLSQYLLEKIYRQLQENIRQRFEALALQHQLNQIDNNRLAIPQKTKSLQHLKQTHAQMHNFYSSNLLNHQVSIQEQQQMKLIIKNYEQRIYELRSSLVNKQAEITYEVYQKKRHSLLKKQNITCFHNQLRVEKEIKKTLEQLKRIKVQVQAIEHAIQFYKSQQSTKQSTHITSVSIQKCSLNIESHLSKGKVGLLHKDKHLSKLLAQLNEQIARNEGLKQQQKRLTKEYQVITHSHNETLVKYEKQTAQNAVKPCQRILDLLMETTFTIAEQSVEQSKEENICVQTKTNDCLFSQRDINKLQHQSNVKVDPKYRRLTLKEKRSKLFKEN